VEIEQDVGDGLGVSAGAEDEDAHR
jgi:hypothetical protein